MTSDTKIDKDKIWLTKDLEIIPIEELNDSHLTNIINMLWRGKEKMKTRIEGCLDPLTVDQYDDEAFSSEINEGVMDVYDKVLDISSEEIFFIERRNRLLVKEAWKRKLALSAAIYDTWRNLKKGSKDEN